MKNYIFLVLLLGVVSCFTSSKQVPQVSIKTLWQYDTCGTRGFRLFFISYIEKDEKTNFFIGKNIELLNQYLGNPDTISNCEDGFCSYWYCIDSSILENGKCSNSQNKSLYVLYEQKSKKIILFNAVIH